VLHLHKLILVTDVAAFQFCFGFCLLLFLHLALDLLLYFKESLESLFAQRNHLPSSFFAMALGSCMGIWRA